MSAIVRALWFLESRFPEDIGLDELARSTGLAPTYLSRMFPLATGYTISGYLRGRRLTEAAKALADGAPDILSVALDAGYGSHEAFTRAFREQFGLTPDTVRKRRSLDHLNLVEALRMEAAINIELDPPRIEKIPTMRLAALPGRHDLNNPSGIPAQWNSFGPLVPGIEGVIPGAAYGVVGDMTDGQFDYAPGVQITPDATVLSPLTVMTIPARKWARFTHKGHVSNVRATCAAIYGDWLPNSNAEQAEGLSFVEYYGPDFDPRTGHGTIEIWVGLKD